MRQIKVPATGFLSATLFCSGVTFASTLPYAAIVAVDVLKFDNATYALLMTIGSIVGAFASVGLGYVSDKVRDRRLIVISCALMGMLGFALIYFLRNPLAYVLAYCLIMRLGFPLFSQSFSYARAYYNLRQPARAEFMNSVLRSVFAVAWVVVPPAAGWFAATYSAFDLYGVSAAAYLCCAMIFSLMLLDPGTRIGIGSRAANGTAQPEAARRIELPMLIGIGGVFLIDTAVAMHVTTTPLAITNDLGGALGDVGAYASLKALLEIPCMLGWGLVARRVPKWAIIAVAALLYGLYMFLLNRVGSFTELMWLQVLNALAASALLSITISYMQDAIRGRIGLSTSLLDIVGVASSMAAAGLFALAAAGGSYLTVFLVGSALSLSGAAILFAAHGIAGRAARRAIAPSQPG